MKRHGNTLYITTQGAYVKRDGENMVISVEQVVKMRVPIHTIASVVCFGNVMWTPHCLGLCGEHNVPVSFLSESGRLFARMVGPQSGSVLLRRAQHEKTRNPETMSQAARIIVSAKIANTRSMLQRAVRDHADRIDVDAIRQASDLLLRSLQALRYDMPLDQVRGIEGDAAKVAFAVYDHLILIDKKNFFFHERSRRPPLDRVNALLSFVYTLLAHDLTSACEAVGLDPQMGFLHADRPGRPSLALDMMEEFRPWLADRLTLSLINRQQLAASDFKFQENGSVLLSDSGRKTVLAAWHSRKDEEITHPFLNEKMTVGLVPHVQAQLMARWIRGDLDAYPPVFIK